MNRRRWQTALAAVFFQLGSASALESEVVCCEPKPCPTGMFASKGVDPAAAGCCELSESGQVTCTPAPNAGWRCSSRATVADLPAGCRGVSESGVTGLIVCFGGDLSVPQGCICVVDSLQRFVCATTDGAVGVTDAYECLVTAVDACCAAGECE